MKTVSHEDAFREFDKAGVFDKGLSTWEIWNHGVLWADSNPLKKLSPENEMLLIAAHGTIKEQIHAKTTEI